MVRLFDSYTEKTQDLLYSLAMAELFDDNIIINDDGHLPAGVTSPYAYFCGVDYDLEVTPLYFNQVKVPDFWEITGTNGQAEVWYRDKKMANIYYALPGHLRLVKAVDWLDESGKVVLTEHYNKFGHKFATTTLNDKQEAVQRSYYDVNQREVLAENFKTGTIILDWQGERHMFHSKVDFVVFYLKLSGLDTTQVWYNSLSTSFFVSRQLPVHEGEDTLFWQEPIHDSIPGNMMAIFNAPQGRTQRIIVQDKVAHEKMLPLLTKEQAEKVTYLGYIYPQLSEPTGQGDILIMTNSDNIDSLEALVTGLSHRAFHIGALTEMSARLMAFDQYDNVTLYPNIPQRLVDYLFKHCDIYLDINHGSEILSVGRRAFEENQVILGFTHTLHQPTFINPKNLFKEGDVESMIVAIDLVAKDLAHEVAEQRQVSTDESVARYQALLA